MLQVLKGSWQHSWNTARTGKDPSLWGADIGGVQKLAEPGLCNIGWQEETRSV
jgi:hypothetical protein